MLPLVSCGILKDWCMNFCAFCCNYKAKTKWYNGNIFGCTQCTLHTAGILCFSIGASLNSCILNVKYLLTDYCEPLWHSQLPVCSPLKLCGNMMTGSTLQLSSFKFNSPLCVVVCFMLMYFWCSLVENAASWYHAHNFIHKWSYFQSCLPVSTNLCCLILSPLV